MHTDPSEPTAADETPALRTSDPADSADWPLIARYCAGEATPDEREAVDNWAATRDGGRAWLLAMEDIWRASGAFVTRAATEASLRRTRERLGLEATSRPRIDHQRATARRAWPGRVAGGMQDRWRPQWQGAAVAAAMCTMLIVGFAAGSVGRRARPAVDGRGYVTGNGQRLTMTLVDGTRFTLAPGSRLRLDPAYGRTRRDVTLDGEAFFAVTHDARRPFAVNVHNSVITDVGTQFDVRAYATDSGVRVAVAEGEVAVGPARRAAVVSAHPAVLIAARDVAVVSPAGATVVNHGIDPTTYTAWTTGRLTFDDIPLGDAVADMARWYGVEIHIADASLAARHIRAAFPEESVDALVTQLAPAVDARVERRDGVITLYALHPAVRP